jgi:hypothetical protein
MQNPRMIYGYARVSTAAQDLCHRLRTAQQGGARGRRNGIEHHEGASAADTAIRYILSSRENPRICGIDDAEVVGDLIAVDMPVPRHLLAQKSQYRTFEILEPSVAFVVSAVPVHQTPQSFDRVQMWAV